MHADETIPEPTQKTDVPFRLFRTQNIYMLLKLDTRNGMIWEVQYGMESAYRWIAPINLVPLADGKKLGRFTLVPTLNIFNFLLLDQEDGRTWQVQWNTKRDSRFILQIDTPFVEDDPVQTTP